MSHAAEAGPTIQHHLDEPITLHMRPDTSRININQTVGEALAAIRNHPPEGRVIYFYVVDDDMMSTIAFTGWCRPGACSSAPWTAMCPTSWCAR